jgi:uncharacterized membrane protein YidH (DUF202 family)
MNLYLLLISIFLPNLAYAVDFGTLLDNINGEIVNPLIKMLIAVAIAVFVYGIVEFIANADNENKRTTGKRHMLWGVIGLTIMLGVYGILNIVVNTLEIDKQVNPEQGWVNLKEYNP